MKKLFSPAADKEKAMADFYANKIQPLVATSLIEVGVGALNVKIVRRIFSFAFSAARRRLRA